MPRRSIRTDPEPRSFWHRPGEIALYPLRGDALLTLSMLTAFGALAWLPGIGWLLSIVAYFFGYKYAFEILLATANGRDDSPAILLDAQDSAVWRLLALLLVLLLLAKLAMLAGLGGITVSVLVVLALFQPSILVSLATGDSLLGALNPAKALRMIERIGGTYFLVAAALLLIQGMVLLAAKALVPVMPRFAAALLVDALFYWGLFASFHLLGRVMYHFHDKLGYTPSVHADALPTLQDRDQALLDQAAVRADGNDLSGAISLLRDDIRERSVTPAVHERYRLLLRQAGDTNALDAHAARFIAMLAQDKQERRALGLLREALDANPGFAGLDPDHGEWLARRAQDLGQFRLAVDAWVTLLRADPRHPHAPQWALQAAQLLLERFGEPASARTMLLSARDRCRDESDAAKLDAAIQALLAQAGASP